LTSRTGSAYIHLTGLTFSEEIMRITVIIALLTIAAAAGSCAQDPDSLTIGQRFHRETGFDQSGYVGENIGWGRSVPLYKTYPEATRIKLPKPDFSGMPLEEAISRRRSVRSFADKAMPMNVLAQLLLSADGITGAASGYQFRSAPSGGALYPIDIYVIAADVADLTDGLYHFQVADNSLELVREGDFSKELHEAANKQHSVGSSPVAFVMTARFDRSTKKYADRGYRYTYIEAGAICENVYLQATSLGLGTVAVGAFNDEWLNDLLEIDGLSEAALLIMPIGYPSR
jgi:SagB-type dehydrogenase family enzyme